MVSVNELLQERPVNASRRLVETQAARRERGDGAAAWELDELLAQNIEVGDPSRSKSRQNADVGTTPSAKNARRGLVPAVHFRVEPSDAESQHVPFGIGAKILKVRKEVRGLFSRLHY